MSNLLQLSKITCPILILGQISVIVFVISSVSAKSIWDPFCKEDILYTSYVRVFQKGRPGTLVRDRGSGFISVKGLKDIYVCTNGLVMLYYTKTTAKGQVYEDGGLHWTPHHCELYNPSSNNGARPDHPKKTLLSILLIGHPKDYRKPALQMFVAPVFDKYYGDYINLTSLIMMGTQGECIIEKGVEKARLRVRNQPPKYIADLPFYDPKPPIFCQLDTQRNLGQQGIITLAKPGNAGIQDGDLYVYKGRKTGFRNTPLANSKAKRKYETGSNVQPRFFASNLKGGLIPDALGNFADVADEVYASLIHDRKMQFVGCHTYPDFTLEQMIVLEGRKLYYEILRLADDNVLIKDSDPFWGQQVPVPWPDNAEPKTTGSRYSLYLGVDVSTGEFETYDEAKQKLDAAAVELYNKTEARAEEAEIKAAENNVLKERMLFSLWPLKKTYADLYKYVGDLEVQMKEAVLNIHENRTGCHNKMSGFNFNNPMVNLDKEFPVVIAHWKRMALQIISKIKMEFRLDPYNEKLVEEYNDAINKAIVLSQVLRKQSILLGPMISNSEAILSRLKYYKGMLFKTHKELEKAAIKMESTGKPYDEVVRDPFERSFLDIMIEITDAVKADGSPDEDNLNAKACHELPSVNVDCKAIKPSSERAYQLLKNRQSKVRTWSPDDKWRGKVLDVMEGIFQTVCPYIEEDFASSITKMLTGYLLAQPLGTGLRKPIVGSRLEAVDHQYQTIVYNTTYNETDLENMTEVGEGKLRPMQPFWEQLLDILEECKDGSKAMEFWQNQEKGKPNYITYRKFFPNNNSEAHYAIDDLMMLEKADLEYTFNWAVEMNWRIFSTVLGICMPRYEYKIPLISARFYSMYSRDFLHPLRQIWMSNRDNPVLQTILGNYFFQGKAERWTKACMESSYMESGDRTYRPPRSLYVNAFTEMNYFLTGPLTGECGLLAVAEGSL